jgi:hypothetical protein
MTANVGERFAAALLAKDWDGDYVCEQTAYCGADAGKITKLRILCTGFVPSGNHG